MALLPLQIHKWHTLSLHLPLLFHLFLVTDWLTSSLFQAGCLAADAEIHMPGLTERATTIEAILSVERPDLVEEREKANEAIQDLEIAWTITANKEKELEWLFE